MSATLVRVHSCSLCLSEGVKCYVYVCAEPHCCACAVQCNAMHASTLLHNQIMPVFISGMINGLGPMEAGSTKDSFGYLTIFYV